MTYLMAKQKAMNKNPDINMCQDYNVAWVFKVKNGETESDSEVVILKSTGAIINTSNFFINPVKDAKNLGVVNFSTGELNVRKK